MSGRRVVIARGAALVVVLAAVWFGLPSAAMAQSQCPEANPTYTDACGPTYVLPGWGDAGGWADPSQYATIQLADLNGDGREELLGRNDQGLEIWTFDTSVGQWRPQVDANGTPVALSAFASPAPGQTPATDWTKPEYYSTIQAVDLNRDGSEEVLGRFADGMHIYRYTPPAGTKTIDGGTWALVPGGNRDFPDPPFSDADGWTDPSSYMTIRTGHFDEDNPATVFVAGRSHSGLEGYEWLPGFGWGETLPPDDVSAIFADAGCATPSCYAAFRDTEETFNGAIYGQVVGRNANGLSLLNQEGAGWGALTGSAEQSVPGPIPFNGVFSDIAGGPDCPFAGGGGNGDCLGSSPSYYETLNAADVDGDGNDEVFARTADGLRVYDYTGLTGTSGPAFPPLPTLSALSGAAASVQPGAWGSIRTGDINGDQRDEVLALDAKGLEAYSYQPSTKTWSQLPGTLGLTGDWLTDPELFSTIQVGDVDGDGHADVVARGPYGIRTWFYNRRGTGGWERYLPGGYAAFPTAGQQAAFAALNTQAAAKGAITGVTQIRQVWTTGGEADPTTLIPTLSTLQSNLASPAVGNCSNETDLAPPTYGSCVPPAGSSGFTAADWTAVVNEQLGETYSAQQVLDHFTDLRTIREGLFESQSGALPAIGNDLQLAGAAGTTANYDLQSMYAGAMGIAASIAGVLTPFGPEVSAGLWVASELTSMLPSASPSATTTSFPATYDGLTHKLAVAQDEMSDAWLSQTQQVLGDQGLLDLVGELRQRGTWKLDIPGVLSASRQAFVLNVYQTLLPTVYQRYAVTNCRTQGGGSPETKLTCELPTGESVISGSDGLSATWLALPADSSTVCTQVGPIDPYTGAPSQIDCDYATDLAPVPDSLADIIWGSISDTCSYQPGNDNTLWEFGCSLGVPKATSIGADSPGWTFTTTTGNPDIFNSSLSSAARAVPGVVTAGAARARAVTARVRTRAAAPRTVLGPLRFAGRMHVSRGLRMRRLRVVVDRTLFEHGRREELARSASGRRLRPFALRQRRHGVFTTAGSRGPRARLRLRGFGAPGQARLDLRLSKVRTRDIRALCAVLPAGVSRAGRPLELETRLRMSDGTSRSATTLRQPWRCARDRKGEFTGIRPVRPRPTAARPGLAVHLRTPRVLTTGRRATVLVTVTNRRRARPSRVESSLWHLRITGTAGGPAQTVRAKELRARRSRTLRLRLPVPDAVGRRLCVRVTAGADSARPAHARRCVRISGALRFTG